jgi:hypothetical protein
MPLVEPWRKVNDDRVWRRRPQPAPNRQLLLDLTRMVMGMDDKIDRILRALGEDDAEEEMDT